MMAGIALRKAAHDAVHALNQHIVAIRARTYFVKLM
jgi:hypothetical protein